MSKRKHPSSENGEDEHEGNVAAWMEDEDNDYDDGDDEEDDGAVLRQQTVSWKASNGKTYTAELKLSRHYEYRQVRNVSATLYDQNHQKIGTLEATILRRPSPIFFEMGDAISGELQRLTSLFCDKNGKVTRVSTDLEGPDVWTGGFFHLSTVQIRKAHKGQDLGLRLLHETLLFARDEWVIIVMEPGPLLRNNEEDRVGLGGPPDHPTGYSAEQKAKIKNARSKILRHWARMGFQQAGRNADQCDAWYMTSRAYFHQEDDDPAKAINRWKSKVQMENLDIFVPPPKPEPSALDLELKTFLLRQIEEGSSSSLDASTIPNAVAQVEELVRRGASIHNSRALFALVANMSDGDQKTTTLFQTLVRLGADVNTPDENGNRPLHVAAASMKPSAMKLLIEAGANRTIQNDKGETPLQRLEKVCQDIRDFQESFGISIARPAEMNRFLESAKSLMPDHQLLLGTQLVDGWLSPQMLKMLEITAELSWDRTQREIGDMFTRPDKLVPLHDSFFIAFLRYIPGQLLQRHNPAGLSKSFIEGWSIVWEAIVNVIHRKQAPTLSRVQSEVNNRPGEDIQKFKYFIDKGGKIEYALDALLRSTQNVKVDGNDGWEYETFQDDIEALPATPLLDGAFDLARVKCFEITNNNFMSQPRGPYPHDFPDPDDDHESDEY